MVTIDPALTDEQLEAQIQAINTTRYLMERSYNGSPETVAELLKTLIALTSEQVARNQK
jgi:hypothetical protein